MSITLEVARQVIQAATEKAMKIKVAMNIAIVDRGSNLVAFVRMDRSLAWAQKTSL